MEDFKGDTKMKNVKVAPTVEDMIMADLIDNLSSLEKTEKLEVNHEQAKLILKMLADEEYRKKVNSLHVRMFLLNP
jgi:hypothetical protein